MDIRPLSPSYQTLINEFRNPSNVKDITLDNGFRIIFEHRLSPESNISLASMSLVVKTGFLGEEKGEEQISHLLEHCLFLGTEKYSADEITAILNKMGCKLGADCNATTQINNTSYYFSHIKTDNGDHLTCLDLLYEFCHSAVFPPHLIDKERNTVIDELENIDRAAFAYMRHLMREMYTHPQYERTMAGRLNDSLGKCPAKELQKRLITFYQKWYRPENMALFVVGDFGDKKNQEKLLKYIIDKFSISPAFQNPCAKLTHPPIARNFEPKFTKLSHPEIKQSEISILRRLKDHKFKRIDPVKSLKEELSTIFLTNLVALKFLPYHQNHDSPLLSVSMSTETDHDGTPIKFSQIEILPLKGNEIEAVDAIFLELKNLSTNGFNPQVFEFIKASTLKEFEEGAKESELIENEEVISSYQEHYLNFSTMRNLKTESKLCTEMVKRITLEEMNEEIAKTWDIFHSKAASDLFVILSHPLEVNGEKVLSKIKTTYQEVKKANILSDKPSFNSHLRWLKEPKSIASVAHIKTHKKINCMELMLENNIRLIIKPTKNTSDKISLHLMHPMGKSHVDRKTRLALMIGLSAFENCGADKLSFTKTYMSLGDKTDLFPAISFNSEQTSIRSTLSCSSDFELAMQVLYSKLTAVDSVDTDKFDNACQRAIDSFLTAKKRTESNPNVQFNKDLSEHFFNNHGLYSYITVDEIKTLRSEDCAKAVKNFLSNFTGSAFLVMGNIEPSVIISDMQKFIGSLPSSPSTHHRWTPVSFPEKPVTKISYTGITEDRSFTMIHHPFPKITSCENSFLATTASKVMNEYMMHVIRFDQQLIYGLNSVFGVDPYNTYSFLHVEFSCNTKIHGQILQAVKKALHGIENIKPKELAQFLETERLSQKKIFESLNQTKDYWSSTLAHYTLNNWPLDKAADFLKRNEQITVEMVHQFLSKVCKEQRSSITLTVHPKEWTPKKKRKAKTL